MADIPPTSPPLDDEPTQDTPAPGAVSARYEMISELGRGGMGIVYKARDRETGVMVALKVLRPEITSDPAALERFKNELRLARQITHPNVCRIYEFERAGDSAFITMEVVEGETLRDLLRRRQTLPCDEALQIMWGICDGLEAAHRHGIVHRDLKPANLIVLESGAVKLMDFGLATAVRGDESLTGGIRGTPLYMAPEQAQSKPAGPPADIYAAGLILYEMLTGTAAFSGPSGVEVMLRQIREKPAPPSQRASSVGPELEAVILKCLEKSPAARYQTVGELRAALRHAADRPGVVKSASRLKYGIAVLALFAIVGAGIVRWLPRRIDTASNKTIVVLPCADQAANAEDRSYCDGLVETLASRLGKLRGLAVVPAREVRDRKVTSVKTAREEAGAGMVLTASWQRAGNQARVNLGLVDAESSRILRSDTITGNMNDLFALQDQVASGAAGMLSLDVSPGELARTARRAGANSSAYDYYLRGRGYLQEYDRPENLNSAVTLFQEALKQDPNYALAYAGLGEAYRYQYRFGHDTQKIAQAQQACERAAALDARLPEARTCLGLLLQETGKPDRAVEEFRTAAQLQPDSDEILRGLGAALESLKRYPEAEEALRRAIQTGPHYWGNYQALGRFYANRARLDDAAPMYEQAVKLAPDSFRALYNLGGIYIKQNRTAEAVPMFQRSIAIRPSAPAYSNLATAQLDLEQYSEAAANYRQALKLDDKNPLIWGNLGEACFWIPGRQAEAVAAYRQAVERGKQLLQVNPRDENLLGSMARFHAMMQERQPAIGYLNRALAVAPDQPGVAVKAAIVYNQLGERDKALDWIAKARAEGVPAKDFAGMPNFASLRGNSRFEELLRRP
jgi:serine/threonine-protein kinase